MTTLREAAQQALEALQAHGSHAPNCDYLVLLTSLPPQRKPCSCGLGANITALRAALAEPVQEPVAKVELMTTGGNAGLATRIVEIDDHLRDRLRPGQLLYTAPPQHKPVETVNKTPAQRRERIAAAALQGVLANFTQWLPPDTTWEQIAAYSIRAADALIVELDKPKEQPQ